MSKLIKNILILSRKLPQKSNHYFGSSINVTNFKIQKRYQTTNELKLNQLNHKINVKLCDENRFVIINNNRNLSDDHEDDVKFPLSWLRDNCQCKECFHFSSNSRTLNWKTFNVNIKTKKIWFDESKNELNIIWNDHHQTVHNINWLMERNFTRKNRENYLNEFYRQKKNLWSKKLFTNILNEFKFKDIVESDQGMYDWLECLSIYGVAIIKETDKTDKECRKISDRVGFIKKTHYGEEFIVAAKPDTSNVAYLSTYLQLHTDLPYYEYKPGVNLLHCLVQSLSEGGENILVDGFYVADRIKIENPEMYKILSETLVNWSDIGEEDGKQFHSIYRAPVICENYDKTLMRINHSVPQRDSFFTIPLEDVDSWYNAMSHFVQLLHEESVTIKTKPGDILTFDNIRLLHGRNGYTDQMNNTRNIIGAYLDWDEIYSKIRVLKSKLRK